MSKRLYSVAHLIARMSLEKLPNELIAKIFKYILDCPEHDSDENHQFLFLRTTCKRFNTIINHNLQDLLDPAERFPGFRVNGFAEDEIDPKQSCKEADCNMQCTLVRRATQFKHIVLRNLNLHRVDFSGCIARVIKNSASYFSEVCQLAVSVSQINLAVLHTIINSLPNLQALLLGNLCRESENSGSGPIEGTRRILTEVRIWRDIDDELYEYIIEFLPARRVMFVGYTTACRTPDCEHHYNPPKNKTIDLDEEWGWRYLEKNKDTVQKYLVVDSKGIWKWIDPLSWVSFDATTDIDNWYREYYD